MSIVQLKHYCKFRREEYIILGYHPDGSVLLCNVGALPVAEQHQLRALASSAVAQSTNVLIPILQKQKHPSGADWFTYLGTRFYRKDQTVIRMPLKELEELNPDQKAVFKGYKRSAKPSTSDDVSDFGETTEVTATVTPAAPSAVEAKLDALVEANQSTQALLAQLVQLQLGAAQAAQGAAPKAAAKRGRGRPKAAKKPAAEKAAA